MTAPQRQRWLYRFDNYKRAQALLREAVETLEARELSQLEKEGVIQRFEYTWELAWKLLKDYLDHSGVVFTTATPASTIKAAFASGVIRGGDVWMQALDARNRMSQTYNLKTFESVIMAIRSDYMSIFDYETMLERVVDADRPL